ncbi:MAG TPA: ribosomal-processing cysteine protease Prp [Lachnospiraceae bacterium]|nr:ribosomal-processing cysteine protease Prp [Lachnospiraceae bacterium]
MTTITVRKDKNGSYRGFCCMGHAEYARRGRPDILCAAISALTIGTANCLEELAGERIKVTADEENAFFQCDFESILQEKSRFLVDSMVFSLENISREYGRKYLQVKFEEV